MLRALCIALLFSTAVFAADVTGKWTAEVHVSAGSGHPSFVFKQDGEKLSGSYSGMFGEAPVTGTVKGDQIDFTFSGSQGTAHYTGTVLAPDKLKGTLTLGELGEGTWEATKSK